MAKAFTSTLAEVHLRLWPDPDKTEMVQLNRLEIHVSMDAAAVNVSCFVDVKLSPATRSFTTSNNIVAFLCFCHPTKWAKALSWDMWHGGAMGRALVSWSTDRGFKSYLALKLPNNLGQVVHTYLPLSPSSRAYSLVLAKGRWCSAAGKVIAGLAESNGSLPPGGWLIVTCGLTGCINGISSVPIVR